MSYRFRARRGNCVECGANFDLRDTTNILPLSPRRRTSVENLQLLSSTCNQEKGDSSSPSKVWDPSWRREWVERDTSSIRAIVRPSRRCAPSPARSGSARSSPSSSAGRRKSGIAVFELFAIVAVLTAAGSTAYFSVSLLHQNEAITSHELTQTATPLVVAAFLLVFVSVFARLPGSLTRIITLLPLAIAGIVIAALLSSSTWSAGPENASLVALAMLAVGCSGRPGRLAGRPPRNRSGRDGRNSDA